jgi:hypothetical protein
VKVGPQSETSFAFLTVFDLSLAEILFFCLLFSLFFSRKGAHVKEKSDKTTLTVLLRSNCAPRSQSLPRCVAPRGVGQMGGLIIIFSSECN